MAYNGVPPNTPTDFMVQFFASLERKGLINRAEHCEMVQIVRTDNGVDDSSDGTDVDDRPLKPKPLTSPDLHERLLKEIRSRPQLRPVRGGKLVVEKARSRLSSDDDAEPLLPPKRVIKPDFDLFNSFEETSEDEDQYRVSALASSSVADLSPRSLSWQKPDDVSRRENRGGRAAKLQRRHSIVVCESALDRKKYGQNQIECLSLTLDEVAHIRAVLTKAELESLATQPELYRQVSKAKLCFTCRTTRFVLFGEWGTKCRFCKRTVCSKCIRKMNVPVDHFRNIPVYTLNQSNMTQEIQEFVEKIVRSAPPPSVPQTRAPSPTRNQTVQGHHWTHQKRPEFMESFEEKRLSHSKGIFHRSKPSHKAYSPGTIDQQQGSGTPQTLKGPMMVICCDCKAMVTEIVRASRATSAMFCSGSPSLTNLDSNFRRMSAMSTYLARK